MPLTESMGGLEQWPPYNPYPGLPNHRQGMTWQPGPNGVGDAAEYIDTGPRGDRVRKTIDMGIHTRDKGHTLKQASAFKAAYDSLSWAERAQCNSAWWIEESKKKKPRRRRWFGFGGADDRYFELPERA